MEPREESSSDTAMDGCGSGTGDELKTGLNSDNSDNASYLDAGTVLLVA